MVWVCRSTQETGNVTEGGAAPSLSIPHAQALSHPPGPPGRHGAQEERCNSATKQGSCGKWATRTWWHFTRARGLAPNLPDTVPSTGFLTEAICP